MFDLDFSYSLGRPRTTALFRIEPKDFVVTEIFEFAPTGSGEHVYLKIKKRRENTAWIAEQLAQYFNIKTMDVGYSGMKDRHAVTTQWFSIYLPNKIEVDTKDIVAKVPADIDILSQTRHSKKLRRGDHQGNSFDILLRNVVDVDDVVGRLEMLARFGVPNYFGEQRFGREGNNLNVASNWFEKNQMVNKKKRGIIISAARSYLFNQVLSTRVDLGNWQECLLGDINKESPTGPMWGRGLSLVSDDTLALERNALSALGQWCEGLEHCGLEQARRPLVLMPSDLEWQVGEASVRLRFKLKAGQFATSLLREVALLEDASMRFNPSI